MSAPIAANIEHEPLTVLPPELYPSVEHLVTEDDTPVDSVYSEKQMRLLTRPLYSSWAGPNGDHLFLALANVGMFAATKQPPIVPDVLLSLGVKAANDMTQKVNRSYFYWVFGKWPEVVIEIVSNKEGGELVPKKDQYAKLRIPYYVIWDPLGCLSSTPLQVFGLHSVSTYATISPTSLDEVGLGLCVWHGTFEQMEADWLRWCDREGKLIPLGEERAEQEHLRAEQEHLRAEQEHLRAEQERKHAEQEHLGAEQERKRAEQEHLGAEQARELARQERERAEKEETRAEKAEQRLARLEAQLRREGIEPTNGSPQ
jgi:hypothetical protein